MSNRRKYRGMPSGFDPQELLPGLDAEITRRLAGTLDQKAVLPLIDELGLLEYSKQGLVDLEGQGTLGPVRDVTLGTEAKTQFADNNYEVVKRLPSEIMIKDLVSSLVVVQNGTHEN